MKQAAPLKTAASEKGIGKASAKPAPSEPARESVRQVTKSVGRVALASPVRKGRGRRIQVRSSPIHGKGVFAVAPIASGELVIEYKGEVISWPEALRRHPHDPSQPDHTFYFHIDDERVIDGTHTGNSSRWINHSCAPNCEADEADGRVFIRSLRALKPGEELFFDYRLMIEQRYTAKLKKQFQCRCGAKTCRGTMLAPKR